MSNLQLENAFFELFCRYLPHNHTQLRRMARVCSAVQLAKSIHLSKVACWLPQDTQRSSRQRFLSRYFESDQFQHDGIYQMLLQQALTSFHNPTWHLVIDRTSWIPEKQDLLMASLAYHKRAIPVAWSILDYGPTNHQEQIELLERVRDFLPSDQPIVLHGDAEFGSVPLMKFATRTAGWDFILGQRNSNQFHLGDWQWQTTKDVKVPTSKSFYASNIFWTKAHNFGPLNFFAFYKPYQTGQHKPKKFVRYFTTSLPSHPPPRRTGQYRWGCEPMFRDYKSSGWQFQASQLQNPDTRHALLLVLSINYLWSSSLGRWLCKTGRRSEIDNKKTDITVCFVLVLIGLFISIRCKNRSQLFSSYIPESRLL